MTDNVARAIRTLLGYLRDKQARGQTRIYLTPAGKAALRSLASGAKTPSQPIAAALPTAPAPPAAPAVSTSLPNARPSYDPAPVADSRVTLTAAGLTKADKIADLKKRILTDREARLESLRETMVFSVGDPEAQLMFIGEAPGNEEERRQEPFVGPAGQLLTKIIAAMGLRRERVYISNICKFRPAMPNQGVKNRPPTPEEMRACLPYILAEIDVIQPRVIVGLGGTALAGLTGETTPVSRVRGSFRSWKNYPFLVTYHPSYLLRNESLSERRKVWEDMLLVMEELGMEISERQRAYFTKP